MTLAAVKTPRRLASWIDGFLTYSDVFSSPRLFRKWAAISVIAATIERKLWSRTKGSNLYPNLYVVLVGPPGVGKSAILSPVERLLRSVPDLHVSPSSVTSASLIDTLADAKRKIIRPNDIPNYVEFHYLATIASEMGVFLPMYDPQFMNTLTKLYDGEDYEERRRGNKLHIKLSAPQISLLGGTTPSYLNAFLPEGAWDQGFTSRTVFVFQGQKTHVNIFDEPLQYDAMEKLYVDLLFDLRSIAKLFGKMEWQQEARDAIVEWDRLGGPPVPTHAKLLHYASRRTAHLIKLCMIASASRGDDLHVNLNDYQTALGWLLEAEALMPDIFMSFGGISADAKAIDDLHYYMIRLYAKDGNPIPEHKLVAFLRDRVPSYSIVSIIKVMEQSRLMAQDIKSGVVGWKPLSK